MKRPVATVLSLLLMAAVASAADNALPQTTPEGLVLQQSEIAKVLYVRPGADFSRYNRIAILECPVSFRKHWEQDQDSEGNIVTDKEMDDIKTGLSSLFLKVFTDELQANGGYEIVTTGGADVLVLRPAILDLDVEVPAATPQAGRSFTFTSSAGGMTLYLEFFDSVSSQILARAIDREQDTGNGGFQWQTRAANQADAERILRRWASALRQRLDEIHGKKAS
jgi:hypothetical protein